MASTNRACGSWGRRKDHRSFEACLGNSEIVPQNEREGREERRGEERVREGGGRREKEKEEEGEGERGEERKEKEREREG